MLLLLIALFRLSYKPLQVNFLKEPILNNQILKETLGNVLIDDMKLKLNLLENSVNIKLGNLNYA